MSTAQFRTALTPAEAKAAADRKDAWGGNRWMVIPVEASEYKLPGLAQTFRKDNPLTTNDESLIAKIRYEGALEIRKNPYMDAKLTDYDHLSEGIEFDNDDEDDDSEEPELVQEKPLPASKKQPAKSSESLKKADK